MYVMGTHDVELALRLARPFVHAHLVQPRREWVRQTIRRGEPYLAHHETERGMPAVVFRESDEPEEG